MQNTIVIDAFRHEIGFLPNPFMRIAHRHADTGIRQHSHIVETVAERHGFFRQYTGLAQYRFHPDILAAACRQHIETVRYRARHLDLRQRLGQKPFLTVFQERDELENVAIATG